MGRWLDRLKKNENTQNKHCQNRQKGENGAFDSFVSASNGEIQKKILPSVWDVSVKTGGKVSAMVVIDPAKDSQEKFMAGLIDRFGPDRVINAVRRGI